jgi:hypothetical protein
MVNNENDRSREPNRMKMKSKRSERLNFWDI